MDWSKLWEHLPYWFVCLVLFTLLVLGYTAPRVSQTINNAKSLVAPAVQYKEYPIAHFGCSGLDAAINWRGVASK